MLALALFTIAASAGSAERPSVSDLAISEIFDPAKFFEDPNEHDILAGRMLGRDGVYPRYAIAVRYGDCVANETGGCEHRLDIRFLRIKDPDGKLTAQIALLNRMKAAEVRTPSDARRFARRDGGLEWLETDTRACPGAFEAIEAIRKSVWTPPADHRLVEKPDDTDEIWLHVPVYEVAMSDLHARVSYRGPPYANRPSGKLDALVETLEPCWKPGRTPAPWLLKRK